MARKRTIPVETLVQTQQNRNRALEMRLAGKSQAQIAAETGWSKQVVSNYIKTAIADITRENAEEYLELELARLDAMFAAIWEDIIAGEKGVEWKIDRALAIMDQRAKLTGTYKSAELKAIADAKGGLATETASMIGSFFGKLNDLVAAEQLAKEASDDPDGEDEAGDDE
ncbi:hypothetical protein IU451_29185 [Nocardia cyriacigeorgica]|uniref:hypothetical protein n=1 Tax=Nocardia cyriacigeorgica TaxID=135487 RepID=UPI0018956873|nr:hypothetical protein [Nocardia cyriacigeorgica]MBF6326575.1 hypothetical protein [Nocardia cyriacigeorgica]